MTLFKVTYENFKREDNTNNITVELFNDDKSVITPNASHTWKAKLAMNDKFVGEYPVSISGTKIFLSSANLTRLPKGDYQLELWETNGSSTTIYPNAGFIPVRIYRNTNDTAGTIDPTVDITKIIQDLHQAGQNIKVGSVKTTAPGTSATITQHISGDQNIIDFTIPQGAKGDKGDTGAVPQLHIGTVTKLAPGSTPTATLSGSGTNYSLNLGLVTGNTGAQGIAGSAMTNLTWDVLDLRDSKFNPNYWYPCNTTFFSAVQFTEIVVGVNLYNGMPNDEGAPWGSHNYANGTAFECFTDVIINHSAYGRIAPAAYLLANEFTNVKDNLNPVHVDQNPNNGGYVLWLRGGAKYNVGTTTIRDQGTGNRWVINSSDWTLNGISFPVQKKEPNNFQVCGNKIRYNDLRKVGGVTSTIPSLVDSKFPAMKFKGVQLADHLSAKRYTNWTNENVETLPATDIKINYSKGDEITQACIVRTDGKLSSAQFTFFVYGKGHDVVDCNVIQLKPNEWQIIASKTMDADGSMRALDIWRLYITGQTYVEIDAPYVALTNVGGELKTLLTLLTFALIQPMAHELMAF